MALTVMPQDERLAWFAPQPVQHRASGTRLDRFPPAVAGLLQGRIGPLANLRSSSGCALILVTDAPWLTLSLKRLRHHQWASVGIDCEVIGDDQVTVVHSGDLREYDGDHVLRFNTGLERGGPLAELRLWLPLISVCAIDGIALPEGARLEPAAAPSPGWLAIGDSLTQGFSVAEPTRHWVHRVSRACGLGPAWNLGLGGLDIEPAAFEWALAERPWPLITVGLGSNHAWRDADVARVRSQAEALVALLEAHQPDARVFWLMPPWKALEADKGPRDFMGVPLDHRAARRIGPIREQLAAVLSEHPWITMVGDLMPADHRLLPDGLHPTALGMAAYAERVAAAISG